MRLNNRAFEILRAELKKCAANDPLSQAEQEIVLRRLEKLRLQNGTRATYEELRETVIDIYPQFSEKTLKAAARENRPPGVLSKITWAAMFLGSSAGVLWLVNLPYPMIRLPIARTAPILLLPSYLSMDSNYRGAIASVEQADQLVNNATSPADFERGAEKVKAAQNHLDALPVWFLGYTPQFYCSWFSCSWQFTLDEFKSARSGVARMEAKIFQENNAFKQLTQGEATLNTAKQQYQKAQTTAERQKAVASWQATLDQLEQIPSQTLAGKTAASKLKAYSRDFEKVAGGTLIAAAQQFALEAEKLGRNPSLPSAELKQVEKLWEEAINHLKGVPVEDSGYVEAQKLLATYQTNLAKVQTQQQVPSTVTSDKLIKAAQQFAFAAAKQSQNPPHSVDQWQQVISLWDKAINQLEKISVEDPNYVKAQQSLATYQTNLGIVQTRSKVEGESEVALKDAKQDIQRFIASIPNDSSRTDRNQLISEMQGIINQLQTVKPGTTSYAESQQLMQFAQKKLKQL